jgi:DNA primase
LAALPDLVRQWLPSGEQQDETYVVLNPMREDRSLGSFRINTCNGQWRDYAIGQGGGDPVSLYAYLFTGGDYRAAYRAVANDPFVLAAMATGAKAPPAKTASPANAAPVKIALARQLYAQAMELHGTPAAAYLQGRGLRPTDAWDRLRSSVQPYPRHGPCPTLIAPIDRPEESVVGVQRTYLQPNGKKLDVANPRMTLGQARGGAIRLTEAADQLIVCEGLEDGLTLYQDLGVPIWVACGTGLMHHMVIPDTVRSLTIAADNDAAGELAAQRAADAHNIGGRDVRIMRPDPAFKDFNDQHQGIRK